jgi:hypothetical protein
MNSERNNSEIRSIDEVQVVAVESSDELIVMFKLTAMHSISSDLFHFLSSHFKLKPTTPLTSSKSSKIMMTV